MSVSFFAVYRTPEDAADFDQHYFDGHLAIASKMPGLQDVRVNKVLRNLGGEPELYVITELVFANADDAKAALKSPEGAASAKDLVEWGGDKLIASLLTERIV